MILAQRAAIGGAYDYSAFTQPGEPKVLRFWPKASNDPAIARPLESGPRRIRRRLRGRLSQHQWWRRSRLWLRPGRNAQYLVVRGRAVEHRSESPQQRGAAQPARARRTAGGERASRQPRRSGAQRQHAADNQLFRRLRRPVRRSDRATGHMGSVRIYSTPCAPAAYAQPPIAVAANNPGGGAGGGGGGGVCTPTCVCPPGTVLEGKECVRRPPVCPPPQVFNPATGACACPPGTLLEGKECVPILKREISCRPPLVYDPKTGTCVSSRECKPPLVLGPADTCICPQGTVMQDGKCVPQVCPPPLVPGPCQCPEGTVQDGGVCVPVQKLGSLNVTKTVTSNTAIPLPASTPFAMTITCPPNPSQFNEYNSPSRNLHDEQRSVRATACSVTETCAVLLAPNRRCCAAPWRYGVRRRPSRRRAW